MKSVELYSFFKNWDTKTCLWSGMTFFALLTLSLVMLKADKEYVMTSFGLTGQLVASLMTYVNSNKPTPNSIVEVTPITPTNEKK